MSNKQEQDQQAQATEGPRSIVCKITRGPNVKNEIEQDLKDPAKTRRWNLEIPLYYDAERGDPQKVSTIGFPDPRELQCFIDNNFEFHSHTYRVWRDFLQNVQRNKIEAVTKMIKRSRIMDRGTMRDVYLVQVEIRGLSNKEQRHQIRVELGRYNTVTFFKKRDEKSGELTATATDQFTPHYEFIYDSNNPESINALKYWIEHGDNDILFYCLPSLRGTETLPIVDSNTFINANFAELLECGRRGLVLQEIRDMKAYYLALQYSKGQPTASMVSKSNETKTK